MCVNLTNDYEQTLRNTAALAANLLVTYDLQVDDVRLHRDFMDKICPHRLISEGRVEAFYQMIRDDYTELLKEKVRNTIKRG
jgi:N-acetylmuramoyl-L-alanine amidase CwlA